MFNTLQPRGVSSAVVKLAGWKYGIVVPVRGTSMWNWARGTDGYSLKFDTFAAADAWLGMSTSSRSTNHPNMYIGQIQPEVR